MTSNSNPDLVVTSASDLDGGSSTPSSVIAPGTQEVVFIDGSLPDVQTLVADVRPGVQAIVINGPNGLDQIAQDLAGVTDLTAVHIISHGSTGQITFGGETLDTQDAASYQADLAAIGSSLAPGGDLLLYGCDAGAGAAGQAFVQTVARYTNANVAASSQLVGATPTGDNWTLNVQSGPIDVPTAISDTSGANYNYSLATQNLLFIGTDSNNNLDLFATNGSTVTEVIGGSSSVPLNGGTGLATGLQDGIVIGSTAYLLMSDSTGVTQALWAYDGTTIQQLTSATDYVYDYSNTESPTPDGLGSYNGDLAFGLGTAASYTSGAGNSTLAIYNPSNGQITTPSTAQGSNSYTDPKYFVTLGNDLYFEALDSTTNNEAIYSYDGTSVSEIYNLHPTYYNSTYGITVQDQGTVLGPLIAFNNTLYFGSPNTTVWELTSRTAGSNAATNVTAGSEADYQESSTPGGFVIANNTLFFSASYNYGSIGIWSIAAGATSPTLVLGDGYAFEPVADSTGNTLYFGANYYDATTDPVTNTYGIYSTTGGSATEVVDGPNINYLIEFDGSDYFTNITSTSTLGTFNGTSVGTPLSPTTSVTDVEAFLVVPFAATSLTVGTVDTTAPPSAPSITGLTPATDSGTAGDSRTDDTTPSITGTGATGDVITIYLNGSSSVLGEATVVSGDSWTYDFSSALSPGVYSVTATDTGNGETSALSTAYEFTIDPVPSAPTVSGLTSATDSGAPGNPSYTNYTTVGAQGTGTNGDTIEVYVDGSNTSAGTTTVSGGTWSISSLSGTLSVGSHSLKATETDAYGNVSALSGGYSFTVDTTAPSVSSINLAGSTPNNASSDDFTITFSEAVTGVDATDFSAAATGTIADTGITVTPVSGSVYTVTISGVTGDGTLGLDLNGSGTGIADLAGNAISGGYSNGQTYTIEHTAPSVSSINLAGSDPNNASSDAFTVTFSEAVTGVDATDFSAATTGTIADTGITVVPVSGSVYTVTISGVTGDGTLGLDLNANSTGITDAAGNAATAAYTNGQTYTIEHTAPSVSSIVTAGSNPNNASSDEFTVTFSEAVTGVDSTDFTAAVTGSVADTSITVTPISGSTYTVTVNGVTGDGTLGLDLNANSTGITDAAGNTATAAFTGGQTYTIDHTPPTFVSLVASGPGITAGNGDIDAGHVVTLTVGASEIVYVDTTGGTPTIDLNDGGVATYTGGSGTNALTFTYTVLPGQNTNRLLATAGNANGATITDAAGNSLAGVPNIQLQGTLQIDTTAPTITSESFASPSGSQISAGNVVTFTLNMSEAVSVTNGGNGLPTLQLNDGEVATYSGPLNTSTSALTFSYTVRPGDFTTDLRATAFNTLPSGTTITDAAGNAANLGAFSAIDTGAQIIETANQSLFGSVTHSVTSPGGDIYALYETILGRAPDPIGYEAWVAALDNGTSLTTIAQDLLSSAEYTADYGPYAQSSNSSFVTQLYEDGLHRAPDPTGLSGWDKVLQDYQMFGKSDGASRAQVAVDIALSQESQNDLAPTFQAGVFVPSQTDAQIAQLYYGILDRAPDAGGLASWEVAVAQGMPLLQVAQDFLASPEYTAKFGNPSNAQFVTALYEGALGRAPDASGEQGWLGALNGGTSRAAVALGIAESPEATSHLASQIEVGFRIG
jgi:hypothetical protein